MCHVSRSASANTVGWHLHDALSWSTCTSFVHKPSSVSAFPTFACWTSGPWTGSPPSFSHQQFSAQSPLSSLTSPGKPLEPRLPPPLDKWAVEEGSYTCGGVETITNRGNGVGDEEEWKEGTDSSCFHRWKRRLVIGLWKRKKKQGAEELELFQPTSIWIKRIIWPQNWFENVSAARTSICKQTRF